MDIALPVNSAALRSIVRGVAKQDRDDIISDSWVAHLSGEDPVTAARRVAKRLSRHSKRHIQSDFSTFTTIPVRQRKSARVRAMIRDTDAR